MKGITVRQPWAWAIIHGGKNVENRTQQWSHRGTLAIHAGMQLSDRGMESPLVAQALRDGGHVAPMPPPGELGVAHFVAAPIHMGAIIGLVDLVDAHEHKPGCCDSEWAEPGAVHLVLSCPRPLLAPLPCRGALGLWDVPTEVVLDMQLAPR